MSTTSQKSPLLFLIVGRNEPLYEVEFDAATTTTNTNTTPAPPSDSVTRQNYFVLHSALDLVDLESWTNPAMYLKVVDNVNHQMVSVFLTASHVKFMLLHSGKNEDMVRNYFTEVYELYVKLSMNPFYKFDTAITSKLFDTRVRAIGRRYLS